MVLCAAAYAAWEVGMWDTGARAPLENCWEEPVCETYAALTHVGAQANATASTGLKILLNACSKPDARQAYANRTRGNILL